VYIIFDANIQTYLGNIFNIYSTV